MVGEGEAVVSEHHRPHWLASNWEYVATLSDGSHIWRCAGTYISDTYGGGYQIANVKYSTLEMLQAVIDAEKKNT